MAYDPKIEQQQIELNKKGANLKVDGILGPLTQAAINKYGAPVNINNNALVPPGGMTTIPSTTPVVKNTTSSSTGTPVITPTKPPPTTTPPPNPPPQNTGVPDTAFLGLMNNLNTGLQQNNGLVTAKTAVVNALLGQQIPEDQLSKLPPDIQQIIRRGDRGELMLQAQVLNDQISGFGKGIASSISYLTKGYQDAQTEADNKKKDALAAIKEYYTATGDATALKSFIQNNYGSYLGPSGVDNIVNSVVSSVTPTDAAIAAIVGNESGGNYQAVSQPIVSGDLAGHKSYGKYQVLDVHIPDWTQQATGQSLTPEQFLANPQAQDAVAKMQIDQLWKKYGNIDDVASMWFTGKPAAESKGLKDSTTGMTSEKYIEKAKATFDKFQQAQTPTTTQTQGKDYNVIGLLSNTSYDQSNETDKNARNYLDSYLKSTNGALPTAASLFGSSRGAAQTKFVNAQDRAKELFAQATGQSLPSMSDLAGTWKIINQNKGILNKINIASDTVDKNFNLAIQGEISNNVNKNATILNKLLDPIYLAMGDPAVNQALVSNGTITQEFANLISTRNAQGTLEADKRMAEELLPFGTSVDAQKAVVARLVKEAVNIKQALSSQQADLYKQVDPLEQNSDNPNRQKKLGITDTTTPSVPAGTTIEYQGKQYKVDADGNMTPI